MYTTTIEDKTLPENIIEALWTRELCKANSEMTDSQVTAQHIDMLVSFIDDTAERRKAINAERALLKAGNEYFAQGYRLKESDRQMRGLSFEVPAEALAWRLVSAGYIATSEAERLQYIVKVKAAS